MPGPDDGLGARSALLAAEPLESRISAESACRGVSRVSRGSLSTARRARSASYAVADT